MADRDFNIPTGPDTTSGRGFDPIPPEGSAEYEALVAPAPTAEPQQVASPAPEGFVMPEPAPYDGAPAYVAPDPVTFAADDAGAEYHAGGLTDEEANDQALDGVQLSFLALKDSIGQGRELKAREKEREELEESLQADREELADRDEILANYPALVAEQDRLIADQVQQRDARKAELSQVVAQSEEATDALARMRDYHAAQIDPYEVALGRARAAAEQAKNDERSRKSELNAAETELKRAEQGADSTLATARHEQVAAAYDEAVARSASAKAENDRAQRAYDEMKEQFDQAEAPLQRSIEDLQRQEAQLKESIERLADSISSARKRRQYCDNVYQYPDETAKLRQRVQAAEAKALRMDAENEQLRDQLSQSKAQAKTAKMAIGVLIAIIVVVIVCFIVLSMR